MAWKTIAAATALLTAGCSTEPSAPANNQIAAATPVSAPANPIQTRYDQTMSGQPLTRPPTPFQLLVTQATYPAGYLITCHKHTYPRYVYLQAGHLRVTNFATRTVHDFSAGDILVEAIDQWHQGQVSSDGPVTVVAFEQVPPGLPSNSTNWPPPPPAENPCRPWAAR